MCKGLIAYLPPPLFPSHMRTRSATSVDRAMRIIFSTKNTLQFECIISGITLFKCKKMTIKPRMMDLFCICVSCCEDIHDFSHVGMQKRATSYENLTTAIMNIDGSGITDQTRIFLFLKTNKFTLDCLNSTRKTPSLFI